MGFFPVSPPKSRSLFSATLSNVSRAVFDFCKGILSGLLKLQGLNRALHGEQPDALPSPAL